MKRNKRVEAWGVAMVRPVDGVALSVHLNEDAAIDERECYPDPRDAAVVRLVECGPDEVPMSKAAAAVVRAAVRLARKGVSNLYPEGRDFNRAIERMKGGGK